jgi:hypothetical protein
MILREILSADNTMHEFPSVGTGNMVVSAPNDDHGRSELTPEDVLHVPSVSYISSHAGDRLARIGRTASRLYRVSHEGEAGCTVGVATRHW